MINVTLLGATGSIGLNTLDVISRHRSTFSIFALTANKQIDKMVTLCRDYQPRFAVMRDELAAEELQRKLRTCSDTQVLAGDQGLIEVSKHSETQYVLAGIVGAAGLLPTLAAAKAGKRILLANKEALVMAGALFMEAVRNSGAELLPVDSEHNAIFQCMPSGYHIGETPEGVKNIILTASGGPFRDFPLDQFDAITPAQAVAHPNWKMGAKISVDSATMMNKGLEVIEAYWLFNLTLDRIQVLLHPQSIIHSMVEYEDGSILAQMGNPDMRIPIAHTLAWPERVISGANSLNLPKMRRLDFEEVSLHRYPSLKLAYDALKAGATVALNAANEVAVAAFLQQQIRFSDIVKICETIVTNLPSSPQTQLEEVLELDNVARIKAQELILTGSVS